MEPLELDQCLVRISKWLPHQGPIKEFVHHNTLHSFQNYPFFEASMRASRLYGSNAFLSLKDYQKLYHQGQISEQALDSVLKELAAGKFPYLQTEFQLPAKSAKVWKGELLNESVLEAERPPGIAFAGLRSQWKTIHNVSLDVRTHPILFRILGQHLDQGISMWRMPHHEMGLFATVAKMVKDTWLPLVPYTVDFLRPYFELKPAEVVLKILDRFVGDPQYFERYLLEMNLGHPGWSGMVRQVELHPETLVERRFVSLLDCCALELLAELAYLTLDLGPDFPKLDLRKIYSPTLPTEPNYPLEITPAEVLSMIWQMAAERTFRDDFILRLAANIGRCSAPSPTSGKSAQAYFCIDDREGSFRRILEGLNENIETFGFAGFFGVDCVFQGVDDAIGFKQCPLPVHPTHIIRERRKDGHKSGRATQMVDLDDSRSLIRGFVISQTLGLWSAIKLGLSIFRPSLNPLVSSSLSQIDPSSEFEILGDGHTATQGLSAGYTDQEMAERVANLFRASGILSGVFAELVFFVGHGASSVNNPYFAAYDCGACSGKAGGPNARAVAMMANRPAVRERLALQGIVIPESTWFVGALHDTTRDEMQFYDVSQIPQTLRSKFERLRADFDQALALNAKERCRRFANINPKIDPRDAILAVRKRSVSIFEPRPELNHATNAACIVGRRSLSLGVDLDRRSFLNSYDFTFDPHGEILATILGMVIPVCGGINLEYYFSRIDCMRYGAGSKLPHNIQGLIGVINGTEGDLLTGLPTQMTEVHEPLRLQLLVEHSPEIALQAVRADANCYQWLENGWIQYLCVDPNPDVAGLHGVYQFQNGEMQRVDYLSVPSLVRSGTDSPASGVVDQMVTSQGNTRLVCLREAK